MPLSVNQPRFTVAVVTTLRSSLKDKTYKKQLNTHTPLTRNQPNYLHPKGDTIHPKHMVPPTVPPPRLGETHDVLISEKALLLAKYLRNEKKEWVPRIRTA
jgi:hypothetical protein